MKNRKEIKLDPNKYQSTDTIRMNLLLSSLYLTAFEILKLSIIEGTKDYFLDQDEITKNKEESLRNSWPKEMVDSFINTYKQQINRYENEIGVCIIDRDRLGLIPSCEWLMKEGVLNENDIHDVKAIRDHRNEIAHELPALLVSKGFDISIEHFTKIQLLIQKIDSFWARNDVIFDPKTWEEINLATIQDFELISSRVAMLSLITSSVIDYLNDSC